MFGAGSKRATAFGTLLTMLAIIAGCTSPAPAQPRESNPNAGVGQNTPRGRIAIVTRDEPVTLDARLYRSHEVQGMVNAPLAYHDEADVVRPLLADKLPSRDDGSWTIEPDGSNDRQEPDKETAAVARSADAAPGVPKTGPAVSEAAAGGRDAEMPKDGWSRYAPENAKN